MKGVSIAFPTKVNLSTAEALGRGDRYAVLILTFACTLE